MSHDDLTDAVRRLATNLKDDIPLARTREEHIRVSARANEAMLLLQRLETDVPQTADPT